VTHDDADRLAAEWLTGELPPAEAEALRRRIDADPAARQALARLEAACAALRQWREGFDRLPPPTLPHIRRRPRAWTFVAAAAAVLLVAGSAWFFLAPRPTRPPEGGVPAPRDWAADEFGGLIVDDADPEPAPELRLRLGVPHDRGMGGPGGKGGPPDDPTPVLRQFARQFDFAFRVPAALPGEYELDRGQPLSPTAARLIYSADGKRTFVYVKASPGPDEAPRQSAGPDRVWTTRRGGVAVAVAGPLPDRESFELLVALFLPEEPKGSP
jgi:hypothetical protein